MGWVQNRLCNCAQEIFTSDSRAEQSGAPAVVHLLPQRRKGTALPFQSLLFMLPLIVFYSIGAKIRWFSLSVSMQLCRLYIHYGNHLQHFWWVNVRRVTSMPAVRSGIRWVCSLELTNKWKTSHLDFLQFGADKKSFASIWKITRRGVAATID